MAELKPENLQIMQKKQIRSFSTDRDELRKLLDILQERVCAAAEIEEKHLPRIAGQSDEQYEQAKKDLRNGFRLFITLSGTDGRKLTGSIDEIFDSPNFPEDVKDLFFNSCTTLQVRYNYYPRNMIVLFLDFGKPTVLNFSILPSQETRNESNVEVSGNDITWVNGVFQEFVSYVSRHPSTFPWLHRHSVYDVLVWLFGLPLSFWICSRISGFVETRLFANSPFLRAAFYVYVFFFSLSLLRVAFHYARWIWPLTEYKNPKNKAWKHKTVLATVCLALVARIVYDLFMWFIK
ncbi:MAG TPA: hypothetical protein PLR60_14380 [Syntrophorhabdaceae bacterium]|nr:hypothetical protein [Syntrophorhabdaceae bacterium]